MILSDSIVSIPKKPSKIHAHVIILAWITESSLELVYMTDSSLALLKSEILNYNYYIPLKTERSIQNYISLVKGVKNNRFKIDEIILAENISSDVKIYEKGIFQPKKKLSELSSKILMDAVLKEKIKIFVYLRNFCALVLSKYDEEIFKLLKKAINGKIDTIEIYNRFKCLLILEDLALEQLKNAELNRDLIIDITYLIGHFIYRIKKKINSEEKIKVELYIKYILKIINILNNINIQVKLRKQHNIALYKNYTELNSFFKEWGTVLAKAQFEFSNVLDFFGTERNIVSIFYPELIAIHSAVKELSKTVNSVLFDNISYSLENFSIKNVIPILSESLGVQTNEMPLKFLNSIPKSDIIIFFIIDGLGLVQYLTHKMQKKNNLINDNFFRLGLSSEYYSEYFLASNRVPDTPSCLTSIYTGLNPSDHKVSAKRVLGPNNFKENNFHDLQIRSPSLLRNLQNNLDEIKVFSPHKWRNNYFLQWLTEESNLIDYRYERELFIKIQREISRNIENLTKGFYVIYHPFLDKKGHPEGPYSKFENDAYSKLNLLILELIRFLLKLESPLKISIAFTADHGFSESTNERIISVKSLVEELTSVNGKRINIIGNNRSLFIGNITNKAQVLERLNDYLQSLGFTSNDYVTIDLKNTDLKNVPDKQDGDFLVSFINEATVLNKKGESRLFQFNGQHGGQSFEELIVPFVFYQLNKQDMNLFYPFEV